MFFAIQEDREGKWTKVYEFTSRRLRDGWVERNYGTAVTARDPRVRTTLQRHDGDYEAWRELARERVSAEPSLTNHEDVLLYEWPDEGHMKWVATARMGELLAWANEAAHWAAIVDAD